MVHKIEREHIHHYRIRTSVFIPNAIALTCSVARPLAAHLWPQKKWLCSGIPLGLVGVEVQIAVHCSIHAESACNLPFHFKIAQLFMRINYLYILN